MDKVNTFNLDRLSFEEPMKACHSLHQINCPNEVISYSWVPLEHLLGFKNEKYYIYCMKYDRECIHSLEGKNYCVNCHHEREHGYYCKLCNYIKNTTIFSSKTKVRLLENFNGVCYKTNLQVHNFDREIEWLKTIEFKNVELVYRRYWWINPKPGFHLIYDYRKIFDSYKAFHDR